MAIYIVLHKKVDLPEMDKYIPIQVGAAKNDNLGYLSDDSGDNISEKNPNFCELTALYWIWKNTNDFEDIGLVHYRRFFAKHNKILSFNQLQEMLKKNDVILAKKWYFKNKVKTHYAKMHNIDDLMKCRKILENKYPDYLSSFDMVMNRKYLHLFNMFFMKRKHFNEYAEWLFDILFVIEKQTNIDNYDDYNKRIYGFLSERLFNVWIVKNNLSIKEMKVLNTEASLSEKFVIGLKNNIKRFISIFH